MSMEIIERLRRISKAVSGWFDPKPRQFPSVALTMPFTPDEAAEVETQRVLRAILQKTHFGEDSQCCGVYEIFEDGKWRSIMMTDYELAKRGSGFLMRCPYCHNVWRRNEEVVVGWDLLR